ncbi:MAG: tetratricopeptide repeat protein [Cyclobacteriaceae bacterium]
MSNHFFALLVGFISLSNVCFSQIDDDWEKMIDQGVSAYQAGDYDKAIELTRKAASVIEKELGKSDPAYSTVLSNLGAIYKKTGQLNAAETMFKEAVEVIEKSRSNPRLTKGEKLSLDQAYQLSINDLVKLYQQMGRYAEAAELQRKIDGGDDELTTDNSAAGKLYAELNIMEKQGDFDAALTKAKEIVTLQLTEKGPQHPNYAKAITRQGILLQKVGKYNQAEPLFSKSLNIYRIKFGNTHPDYATSLNNLASLYAAMGRYNDAEQAYKQTISINESVYGKTHIEYANSLNNLANLYYKTGNKETALSYAKEALKVIKKAMGDESESYINSLSTLAGIYLSVGNLKEAELLLTDALGINERQFGKKNFNYVAALSNIGNLYLSAGEYEKSEAKYIESLEIYKSLLGEKHPDYIKPLFQLARCYFTQKKDADAERVYLEAIAKIHDQIRLLFPGLSDQGKADFYKTINRYFNDFNTFCIYRYQTNPAIAKHMYNNQLKTKAILLNATTKVRNHIYNSGDEELIDLYKSMQSDREKLVKAYNMNAEQLKKNNVSISKLENAITKKEKELSKQSEEFAKQYSQTDITWQSVRDGLKSSEAGLEIIRFTDITDNSPKYAFLLVKSNTRGKPDLFFKNADKLESRYVKYYRNSIKYRHKDEISYSHFWKEIDTRLLRGGIRKVYVSPDGVYNQISLNTLLDPLTNKYVLQKGIEIHMVSNTKDFLDFEESSYTKKTLKKRVTLMGNPNFNRGYSKKSSYKVSHTDGFDSSLRNKLISSFSSGHIVPLPGTAKEIVNITTTLKKNKIKATAFVEDEASEENIKLINNPKLLHIATHGFFMENVANKEGASSADAWLDNPLLRSGILLAGAESAVSDHAGNAEEDGILTSYEAMNLELNKTDLVVLSACETGLGEVSNGEGVYGLQRSLQVAGAKTILMSLWTVNDEATQQLMTSFYNYLFQFQNKRAAFKQAQKDLLAKYNDPNLWGAFVMIGQ